MREKTQLLMDLVDIGLLAEPSMCSWSHCTESRTCTWAIKTIEKCQYSLTRYCGQ